MPGGRDGGHAQAARGASLSPGGPMPYDAARMLSPATDLDSAMARIAALRARAADVGVPLRAPPPHPTTCCGRGCNGCVWEGYFAAVQWWIEDGEQALAAYRTALS